MPPEQREYERSFDKITGYQCTSIADYEKISNDIDDKLKELERLRNQIKKIKGVR